MAQTQYQIFCRYLNEENNKIVTNLSKKTWISAKEWYETKLAYHITDETHPQATVLANDSVNFPTVKKGDCYRKLYDAIIADTIPYDSLSLEEQTVYNTCKRYTEIEQMIADNTCVVEYAMVRPAETLITTVVSSDEAPIGATNGSVKETQLKAAFNKQENELLDLIFNQLDFEINEKYNMLFVFNGMITTNEQIQAYVLNGSIKHPINEYRTAYKTPKTIESKTGKDGSFTEAWFGRVSNYQDSKNQHSSLISFTTPPAPCVNPKSFDDESYTYDIGDYQVPLAVYDSMKRLEIDPWFHLCTCNSLNATLTKVKQLVPIYGISGLKVGKVVNLEQYVDIT